MAKQKWLTNQLLDLFENLSQTKNLIPVCLTTKKGNPVYQSYTKFTPLLRIILLAIAKYPICIFSIKTIIKITGAEKRTIQDGLKVLYGNKIINIKSRYTDCGDPDTNLYEINLPILCSFFEGGGAV